MINISKHRPGNGKKRGFPNLQDCGSFRNRFSAALKE
jgi:hypothetical protein